MKARRFNTTLILALAFASAIMTLCLLALLMANPAVPDTQAAPVMLQMTPMPFPTTDGTPQQLAPDPTPTATPIPPPITIHCNADLEYGQIYLGNIVFESTVCEHKFSGVAGDVVTIAMNKRSGDLDPYLELKAPSGTVVAKDDDGGDGRNSLISGYELDQGGTYTILAQPSDPWSTGGYEISLTKSASRGCGGAIRSGQTVDGEIPASGEDCRYTFSGSAGDEVTIRMTKLSSSLDPWLDLLDPYCKWEYYDDDGAGDRNSLIRYTLQRSGTYIIVATSYQNRSAGDFELYLSSGGSTTSCGGAIRSGQTLDGEIPASGEDCRYTFSGSAGDEVTIRMTKLSSSLDPWLDLLDPDGKGETYDDDGAGDHNSLIENHTLRRDGTYTIVAKSYKDGSAGDFELYLSGGGGTTSCSGAIRSGQTVDGEIPASGEDCRYTFSGSAGDEVTIRMTKLSSPLDPWLDLLDPYCKRETYDDDGGGNRNSLIENHTLQRSGTYTIVAKSYRDRSAGDFELELTIR